MSNQEDIYDVGFENCPPMLKKENYVPWSSRLLRYAKSRPNGKLIYNSIMNSPYVRRMIPEPGDTDRKNPNRNDNVVAAQAEGNASRNNARIQLQAEEFDLMTTTSDHDEIKEVNANCILMVNLQQASTLGKRGLRQGDPLSPYLFTLVMEILTLILKRKVRLSDTFRYHKNCEELDIINICFADDLFIFARGDVNSAKVIMDSLVEFKQFSGMIPSIPKSTTFFCNVLNHVKMAILNIMPFAEEELPVKYLGVFGNEYFTKGQKQSQTGKTEYGNEKRAKN
nr:putative reverse transcriptase domain, reverse transcriptase zinc-binding domain protein [Tanacetum cinerariifolium]